MEKARLENPELFESDEEEKELKKKNYKQLNKNHEIN